ncbi:hypothetical protein Bra471DRAFT_01481 [Bradyrhizobium sp. WSM471]|nr:hypothetical protein Bra471DRAFT_01481 [Bradyrhizobium sp. WSM471]
MADAIGPTKGLAEISVPGCMNRRSYSKPTDQFGAKPYSIPTPNMPPQRTSTLPNLRPREGRGDLIGVARDCGAAFGVKQYVIDGIVICASSDRTHQSWSGGYRQTGCFDWIRSNQPSSPGVQHPTRSGLSAIDSRSGRPRYRLSHHGSPRACRQGNPSNSRLTPSHRSRRDSSRSSRRLQPRQAAELWCREAGRAAQPDPRRMRAHRAKHHNAHSRKQQVLHFYFHLFSAPSLVCLNNVGANCCNCITIFGRKKCSNRTLRQVAALQIISNRVVTLGRVGT